MKIRCSFTLSPEAYAILKKLAKSGIKLSTVIEQLLMEKKK